MVRAFILLLAIAGWPSMSIAQDSTQDLGSGLRISEINENARQWENRKATISGMVDRYADAGSEEGVGFFYLRDIFGDALLVRTTARMPDPRVLYQVSGVVSMSGGTPYVAEEQREVMQMQAVEVIRQLFAQNAVVDPRAVAEGVDSPTVVTAQVPPVDVGTEEAAVEPFPWLWVLLGSAALLVAVLIWYTSRSRRPAPAVASSSRAGIQVPQREPRPEPVAAGAAAGFAPEPGSVIDGKTVRFHAPPPGTVKVLSGHFEIQGDDKDQGLIRLFGGEGGHTEITFGRRDGKPYEHVQLKVPSVSRLQARVRVQNGTYEIKDESGTNPTRVNGREIQDWTGLDEGDRVEMGEVSFVFHDPA